jgi:uncharacterized protein (TIGR03118 family)
MAFPFSRGSRGKRPAGKRWQTTRLDVELLEARALPSSYRQINLVGYQPGMAPHTDPNLNGWGMAFAPDGPFVVADTATGVATTYNAEGKPLPTVVTIPAAPGLPPGTVGSPAGLVYNPTSDFVISANGRSAPARFIFDTLDGLICGWNPRVDPTHAIVMVDNSAEAPFPASYTGLVIARNSKGQNVLYAADSGASPTASNNRFDMFDGSLHSLGSFTDPNVATQYPGNTAFQVEEVGGRLFVTFGGFNPPFGGVVDVFDTDGNLLTPNHFAANAPGQGPLENPWGIVLAPDHFGDFSNKLLIGNVEGAGNINAFDPVTGAFLGPLRGRDGTPVAIPGLWDLSFGGGDKNNGKPNQLFFDAGPNAVTFAGNGLFGMIVAKGGDDGHQGDGEHGDGPHGESVQAGTPAAVTGLSPLPGAGATRRQAAGPAAGAVLDVAGLVPAPLPSGPARAAAGPPSPQRRAAPAATPVSADRPVQRASGPDGLAARAPARGPLTAGVEGGALADPLGVDQALARAL